MAGMMVTLWAECLAVSMDTWKAHVMAECWDWSMAYSMADSTDELMAASKVVWKVMKQALLLAELMVASMVDSTDELKVEYLAALSVVCLVYSWAAWMADSMAA